MTLRSLVLVQVQEYQVQDEDLNGLGRGMSTKFEENLESFWWRVDNLCNQWDLLENAFKWVQMQGMRGGSRDWWCTVVQLMKSSLGLQATQQQDLNS
jgi:hypothetical protein